MPLTICGTALARKAPPKKSATREYQCIENLPEKRVWARTTDFNVVNPFFDEDNHGSWLKGASR
jgi:hypothetical protein